MKVTERDKRALIILGVCAAAALAFYKWRPADDPNSESMFASAEDVSLAERRLVKLRQAAALVPGTQEAAKKLQDELALREKGIVQADTPQQAQAQLLQIMRRLTKQQTPPIDIISTDVGQVRALDNNYGEVGVSIAINCRIEDLVNLLTDVASLKELIATSELRIGAAHPKEKNMPVRLTISGIVRRDLIPEKKVF